MRAKMSQAHEVDMDGNWYDYDAMIGAQAERANWALAEALGILAETEPPQEQGASGHWFAGRPNRAWDGASFSNDESGILSGTAWAAHEAIKVSLAGFINQEMS
mgnify:FL=1